MRPREIRLVPVYRYLIFVILWEARLVRLLLDNLRHEREVLTVLSLDVRGVLEAYVAPIVMQLLVELLLLFLERLHLLHLLWLLFVDHQGIYLVLL